MRLSTPVPVICRSHSICPCLVPCAVLCYVVMRHVLCCAGSRSPSSRTSWACSTLLTASPSRPCWRRRGSWTQRHSCRRGRRSRRGRGQRPRRRCAVARVRVYVCVSKTGCFHPGRCMPRAQRAMAQQSTARSALLHPCLPVEGGPAVAPGGMCSVLLALGMASGPLATLEPKTCADPVSNHVLTCLPPPRFLACRAGT